MQHHRTWSQGLWQTSAHPIKLHPSHLTSFSLVLFASFFEKIIVPEMVLLQSLVFFPGIKISFYFVVLSLAFHFWLLLLVFVCFPGVRHLFSAPWVMFSSELSSFSLSFSLPLSSCALCPFSLTLPSQHRWHCPDLLFSLICALECYLCLLSQLT